MLKKLFPPRRFSRSISLNAHYIIAFDNPRDTLGLRTSVQQAFAGHFPYVWKNFQDTTLRPYVYLVMDLHRRTPITLRLRNNIYTAFTATLPCSRRQQENTYNRRAFTYLLQLASRLCVSQVTQIITYIQLASQRDGVRWSDVLVLQLNPKKQKEND